MDSARIRARIDRQYVVLHAPGDLAASGTPTLARQLDDVEPCTDVVVDMSEVGFCDDDGWQLLSTATRRLVEADGSLTLTRLRPEVRAQLRDSSYADQLKVRRKGR